MGHRGPAGPGTSRSRRRSYAKGNAEHYRKWLTEQGYNVEGMKAPVLVRERITPMSLDERIAYTTEANERTTLELSPTERAMADARKLGPILNLYRGGDLSAAANRDFVRAFVGDVASSSDRGRILDSDGMLSQDGKRRIEGALLASAYGDQSLITDLFESADTDIKSIGGALLDVAGSWAQMRENVREGVISTSVDLTPNLLEAVNIVRRARAEGRPVAELVNQNDFFSGEIDPSTTAFLRIFYRGENFARARSRDRVADALQYYTEQAQLSKPGPNMFGEPEVTGAEILRGVNERIERQEQQASQQQDIFASPRASSADAGASGEGGQRTESAPAREAASQGGLNVPGAPERVERYSQDAGAEDADAPSDGDIDQRLAAQAKAPKTTKWGDKSSIDASLPLLLPEQREDVYKAEKRLDGNNGILFTNGTGTGKTATGLGIAKRFINDGKDNIIIVVPSDKIAADWVKFARMLGINLQQLEDTNSNGKSGPVVTTYANFGQNRSLVERDWDLVIADESHYLSSNANGDATVPRTPCGNHWAGVRSTS